MNRTINGNHIFLQNRGRRWHWHPAHGVWHCQSPKAGRKTRVELSVVYGGQIVRISIFSRHHRSMRSPYVRSPTPGTPPPFSSSFLPPPPPPTARSSSSASSSTNSNDRLHYDTNKTQQYTHAHNHQHMKEGEKPAKVHIQADAA